jgi:ectoine hydroxylase-related dioxygenase (phytanoyl-CoA dioxygenase family)
VTLAGQLAVDGYATIDLLDDDAVAKLTERFEGLGIADDVPFLATPNDLDRDAAEAVDAHLKDVVGPLLDDLLPDHDIFLAGFISKGAGVGGEVQFHQDLTYTDERRYRSVLLWIPLVDVDDSNGALQVVPGSHRWTTGIRAGGLDELPTAGLQAEFRRLAVTVPLKAGQAVIYDAALVHGSSPNTAEQVRPAVAIATAPSGAGLVHFHMTDGGVQGYAIDAGFFTRQSLREEPQGYPEIDLWAEPVERESFAHHVDTTVPDDPIPVRAAAAPPSGRRPLITTRHARKLRPMSPRAALRDPALDLRLRRDGFVKFPLIDRESAHALREQYGRVHGWEGEGFEPDLTNTDVAYRRRVSKLLEASLDHVVASHFDDFRPYLRAFLCKWPGPNSDLYLHRDWMYIDERGGNRSYVVWIALQDVTGEEGQIQVLRHSHRIDSMLRGTNLNAAWIQHQIAIRKRLLTVPVMAGEALVMDNSLVHCSLPNNTGTPRVVAAIGMRPATSTLVHFLRRDGEQVAARYDVDEDFFLSVTPQDLMADPPDLPVAEKVPVDEEDIDAVELVSKLNSSLLTRIDQANQLLGGLRSR